MKEYLLVILFISVGLGQDVLTTKKGIEYKGKMIEAGYDEVKFIPGELPGPQNVKTEIIQSLILSDGTEIVKNGILIRESFVNEESSNSSIQKEEISNLSIQEVIREEAISFAKKDAIIWLASPPVALITSGFFGVQTSIFLSDLPRVYRRTSSFTIGLGLGLSSTYYIFNKLSQRYSYFEDMSAKDIELYRKTYSKEFAQSTLDYGMIGCLITGVAVAIAVLASITVTI